MYWKEDFFWNNKIFLLCWILSKISVILYKIYIYINMCILNLLDDGFTALGWVKKQICISINVWKNEGKN